MEFGGAPVDLSWLWEGLASGVAIVVVVGAFGLVQSKFSVVLLRLGAISVSAPGASVQEFASLP